ncbi:MAG: SAM-dependent methyltransferase [Allomuricauda sp.]|nr:MAG: SAM-dependent methyltransferase [Allomuricauda sp.]
MRRKIITTGDGSSTIHIEDWNEQYHSKHGAIQEAYHVFIQNGLHLFKQPSIHVLEMGFGTGLNALITLLESNKLKLDVKYTGVEAFPISKMEFDQLNYVEELNAHEVRQQFKRMHDFEWGKQLQLTNNFSLQKRNCDFFEVADVEVFDLIYFDAFGARVQPQLWTAEMFGIMYNALKPKGVLVTYAAKGSVRRAMQEVGYAVERLPGPPGKREMLRATRP